MRANYRLEWASNSGHHGTLIDTSIVRLTSAAHRLIRRHALSRPRFKGFFTITNLTTQHLIADMTIRSPLPPSTLRYPSLFMREIRALRSISLDD